jgi:hypothetical protein
MRKLGGLVGISKPHGVKGAANQNAVFCIPN